MSRLSLCTTIRKCDDEKIRLDAEGTDESDTVVCCRKIVHKECNQ